MIRRPFNDGWVVIRQMDHAQLSGALMARWGNEFFISPFPQAEVLFAITEHDNGWEEWERAPEIHPDTGYPLQFNELPFEAFRAIWRRGTARHRKSHPYASLLFALHAENLARRRLQKVVRPHEDPEGSRFLGEGWPDAETARLSEFIAEIEQLRAELFEAVLAQSQERRDQFEAEVSANFRLLQIGDRVSLELCYGLCERFTVDQVPAQGPGPDPTVRFRPVRENTVEVSPYPFSQAAVEVEVLGRVLRQQVFSSSNELRDHLEGADHTRLTFHLMPG